MIVALGQRHSFAIEIGEPLPENPTLCPVDVWAAGQWLTCDDNMAYIPQFVTTVKHDIGSIQGNTEFGRRMFAMPFPDLPAAENHKRLLADDTGLRESFWFFHWGPTTDNLLSHLFRDQDRIVLTFEFWRADHHLPQDLGRVFTAEILEEDFIAVLQGAVRVLAS